MFAFEVRFLTGRYVATSYNDRTVAEWPPHPARLYAALVEAHYSGEDEIDERMALEWLAEQGAPELTASDCARRDAPTVFVPVNDVSVVGSTEKQVEKLRQAERALAEVRRALEEAEGEPKKLAKAESKARGALEKAQKQLDTALAKAIAPDDKSSKDGLKKAAAMFPDGRTRQPRTFPSVTPEEPIVVMAWPSASVSPAQRAALDRLAARVVRLGHSSSLASVRVVQDPSSPTHVPLLQERAHAEADAVVSLRVPQGRQLALLDQAFEQHRATEPRVLPAAHVWYAQGLRTRDPLPVSVFGESWIVLRVAEVRLAGEPSARASTRRLSAPAGPALAKAVRGLILKGAGPDASEILTGHASPGKASESPHLAIVPLPNVGHRHAGGEILGVALVLPREADGSERQALLAALAHPDVLLRDGSGYAWRARLTGGSEILLRPTDDGAAHTLRSRTWCRPARVWLSALPVALDRNPGDMRARQLETRERAIDEAATTISLACERIGLPRPSRVEILPSVSMIGVPKARALAPFPSSSSRTRRVLTHAMVEFEERVRGPVVVGAGRYLGLGLMRPAPGDPHE